MTQTPRHDHPGFERSPQNAGVGTPTGARSAGTRAVTSSRWVPFEGGVALDSNEDSKAWKVFHDQYTIAVIRHGAAEWTYRGRNFTSAPGSVFVCEPGEVHTTTRVHCPGDFTAYFLDQHTLSNVGEQLGLGANIHFTPEGVALPELWRQFAQFRGQLGSNDAETRGQTFSRLLSRLAVQSKSPAANRLVSSPRTCLSERTLQQCRQNLTDAFLTCRLRTVRLQPIARDLGVSYHSLIHDFSRRFGIAPYEYVDALRARYAFALLRRGPTADCPTLKAAAMASGYSDGAHMSRKFKQHFGVAPSAVARDLEPRWVASTPRAPRRS